MWHAKSGTSTALVKPNFAWKCCPAFANADTGWFTEYTTKLLVSEIKSGANVTGVISLVLLLTTNARKSIWESAFEISKLM
jgi:hypothetical protein